MIQRLSDGFQWFADSQRAAKQTVDEMHEAHTHAHQFCAELSEKPVRCVCEQCVRTQKNQ